MKSRANPVYCSIDTIDLAHATNLVVGRPIYQAADPRAAAEAIAREAGVNDL